MNEYDNVVPKQKWEFDSEVTRCFENMLERSIPQYQVMRQLTVDLADALVLSKKDNFNILDLGCSNGLNLREFVVKYASRGRYLGIDCSQDMLDDFTDRFKLFIDEGVVKCQNLDLRTDFPDGKFDLITSILSLCFIPIQYRQAILNRTYEALNDNGVLIVVEKVLGNSLVLDEAMVDIYYNMKREHGYTDEQIERKRLSLDGVQVPIMSSWNIEMLKNAGFQFVDCFWRWMNFAGYVAIKR